MLDLDSIVSYLLEKNFLGLWLLLFFGLVINHFYKKFIIHPRVLKRLLIILFILLFPIVAHINDSRILSSQLIIVNSPVIILILASIIFPLPHEWLVLFWIKKRTLKRTKILTEDFDAIFQKYFISTNGIFKYTETKLRYFQKRGLVIQQYKSLQKLEKLKLFVKQKIIWENYYIVLLVEIGAIKKAELLIEKSIIKMRFPVKYDFIKALIFRHKLLFVKERDYLLRTINQSKTDDEIHIMAQNNYAVNAISRDNKFERYEALKRASLNLNNSSFIKHNIFPNLIDYYLLEGDDLNASKIFDYYSELINPSDTDDLIHWNNYKLVYYRQKNEFINLQKTIDFFEEDILPKLSKTEKYNLSTNILRIRWNNKIGWEKSYLEFLENLEEYLNQPFEISFKAAKELFFVFRGMSEENIPINEISINRLINFLKTCNKVIDEKILQIPSDFIFQKCNFLKDIAWLHQITFDYKNQNQDAFLQNLDKQLKLYYDIIDILENEGALIDALEIRLNIPDTILNLFVVPRELYFYPFEDNNVEKYLKVAKSEMDISLGIISQCTNDISILNFKLILAHYFACLKDSKQAKVLFDEFNSAGVSLNHCAFWLKKIHEKLSLKFTKMPDI